MNCAEKKMKHLKTPTSEYSTAEIKDYTGISPAAREEHHLDEFREETRTVAYISARSGSIVCSRQSSWLFVRHFVDRLGALRERNTVATMAKRVPWCELRETERKRDKWKNKERGGEKERKKEGNRANVSDWETGEKKKERNVRGGPKGQQKTGREGGEGGKGGTRHLFFVMHWGSKERR